MDGPIFLSFVMAVVIGVVFLAFTMKILDSGEERAEYEERKGVAERVPPAKAIASKVPAFFRVQPATRTFTDRAPMLHEINRRHILWALDQARGDHAYAAGLLGTSERDFEMLVCTRLGDAPLSQPAVQTPSHLPDRRAPSIGGRETVDERLFGFIQNRVWAEQAVVSEFIHLPSIDTLYREASSLR